MPELVMEDENTADLQYHEYVQLEPFVHQVGGHSSMLRFNDNTVCKPLIFRERYFYETMPPEIKEFTPQYRGVVEVSFVEDDDGYVHLVAFAPKKKSKRHLSPGSSPSSSGEGVQSDSDSESNSTKYRRGFRMRRTGSIEIDINEEKTPVDTATKDKDILLSAGYNPWSLHCQKAQLTKMWKNKGTETHKFILLENLASRYKMPCILDLKMGTRQHGDDASEEKRQHQVRKCESTTSSTLGLRICGMQVYQGKTGHYRCHNKYYGRRLTTEGVEQTLYEYLHNGYNVRLELISAIVERLRRLHAMLSKQNAFRFYSSSLLIMYEGGEPDSALMEEDEDSSNIYNEMSDEACDLETEEEEEDSLGPLESDHSIAPDLLPSNSSISSKYSKDLPARVDVRMIDFAHATHQGFRGDRTPHSGPDKGYLFGLENLIRMFERLKDRCSVN